MCPSPAPQAALKGDNSFVTSGDKWSHAGALELLFFPLKVIFTLFLAAQCVRILFSRSYWKDHLCGIWWHVLGS